MQPQISNQLTDQERAYIKMLEQHFSQTVALLATIGGTKLGAPMGGRELSLAFTKLEEAFYHSREYILRRNLNRAKLN